MKILYVLPALEFGGAERFLVNLIRGHSPVVHPILLTFSYLQRHLEGLPCQVLWLDDLGVEPSQISAIFFKKHVRSTWHVAHQVAGVIKRERPDVAVGVLHVAAFLLAVTRDLFGIRTPCVANLHGDATGYLQGEVKHPVQRFVNRRLLRYLCGRAESIIVPSEGIARDLVERFRVQGAKVRTVPNGLDLEAIRCQARLPAELPWRVEETPPLLLAVGRLSPEKAFHLLVEAFALLRKRRAARLIILGEGGERARLEGLVRESGAEQEVWLPGFVENPYPFMSAASIFALSSIHEGLPTVVIEAMACGCPVVSTDCPSGPREIIRDGENGLLVPVNDPPALADALSRVLADEALRRSLIAGGLKRAEDFTIPAMVEGYERVYQKILGTEGRNQGKGSKIPGFEWESERPSTPRPPAPLKPPLTGIEIRFYRPGDEAGIVRLFQVAFNKEMTLQHWRWKYQGQGNPRTYAAVAVDDREEIVAHYGGVPLHMVHQGRPIKGLAICDIMVHPQFRGIFLKEGLFQRVAEAIPSAAVQEGFVVGYGFPQIRAVKIGEAQGFYERVEEVVEASRPVRFHQTSTRFLYELFPIEWTDERLDAFWDRVGPTLDLAVVRDRAHLAWRYNRHPLHSYQIWGFRRRWSRRLAGWAVVRDMGETLCVMDLLFKDSPLPLLDKLDNMAVTAGKPSLTLWLPPRYHGVLEAHGFTLKPTGIVIPRTTHPGTLPKEEMQGKFYYTLGDFDVF
jgi:glycosyltransferase involved in cell wall biosynthesis